MTTGPVLFTRQDSTLPDYYAEERLARDRVRRRHSARWLGLAVAVLLLWHTGIGSTGRLRRKSAKRA